MQVPAAMIDEIRYGGLEGPVMGWRWATHGVGNYDYIDLFKGPNFNNFILF